MTDATIAVSGKELTVSLGALGNNVTGRYAVTHGGVYRMYAIGYAKINQVLGFNGVLSGYSGAAAGGAQGEMTLPLPTFSAHGFVNIAGVLVASLPTPTLSAHGLVNQSGVAALALTEPYVLVGKGGAIGRGTLPLATLSAHGLTGATSSFAGVAPSPTLTASGTQGNVGSLDAVLPALRVGSSGVIRATFPCFTLYAVGSSGAAVTYEAYSVSLLEDDQTAVTHYTDYPFDRIVRFGSKYYGVATDGLFELTGDLFDDVPIVAVIRTGETDFKAREVKRPVSMYVAGRVGGDFSVAVTPAEIKDYTYTYHPVVKTGARNYRVMFGKGIRARYLSYVFSNTQGEDFDIDELTPEVAVLRRTA